MHRTLRLLTLTIACTAISLTLSTLLSIFQLPNALPTNSTTSELLLHAARLTQNPTHLPTRPKWPDSIIYAEHPGPIIPTNTQCLNPVKCYCCSIAPAAAPNGGSTVCARHTAPNSDSTPRNLTLEECGCWQLRPHGKVFCTYPANSTAVKWAEDYILDVEMEWLEEEVVEVEEIIVGEDGEGEKVDVKTETVGEGADALPTGVSGGGGGGNREDREGNTGVERQGRRRMKIPEECTRGRRKRCLCWTETPGGEMKCGNQALTGKLRGEKGEDRRKGSG